MHMKNFYIDFLNIFILRITGARENWFNTMPESSSGSSDEN